MLYCTRQRSIKTLASCSDMIAPAPDGLVWLHSCDVGQVTDEGLTLITRGDQFCPKTIEVDSAGVIWGAEDPGEVRLVAGNRWVRIVGDSPPADEGVVIDMAVGTDGRVWLVTGAVLALVASLVVTQAWNASAAPGDSDSTFVPITTCRLVDTREPILSARRAARPVGRLHAHPARSL